MKLQRLWPLLLFLACLCIGLWVFAPVLSPEMVLQAPDAPVDYTQPGFRRRLALWMVNGPPVLHHDALLRLILPSLVVHELTYLVSAALTALAMGCYLRTVGLPVAAACLGGGALAFCGYNFTLFNAGHTGYFTMMPYAVFLFACIERAVRQPHWTDFALAAVCTACGLSAQPDVMVLVLGLAAFYTLTRVVCHMRAGGAVFARKRALRWALGCGVALVCFGLFAHGTIRDIVQTVLPQRAAQIAQASGGSAAAAEPAAGDAAQQRHAQWIFATNWSLPPEDCLEFVAPCLRGLDTGNPKGPYWGRLGRSENWEQTQEGFGNFRQHSMYLGAISCSLALLAVVWMLLAMFGRRRFALEAPDRDAACVTAFWFAASVLCVLFAMGRYTPVYRLLYAIPFLDQIRAPVKFVHLAEIAVSVLAAFGAARLLAATEEGSGADRLRRLSAKVSLAVLTVLVVALGILASTFRPEVHLQDWRALGLLSGSAETDGAIALAFKNQFSSAVLRGAWFMAIAAAALAFSAFPVSRGKGQPPLKLRLGAVWLLAVIGTADLAHSASRFVTAYDVSDVYRNNPALEDLKKAMNGTTDGATYAYTLVTGSLLPPAQHTPFGAFAAAGVPCADPSQTDSPDTLRWLSFRGGGDIATLLRRHWSLWGTEAVFAGLDTARELTRSGAFEAVGLYDLLPPERDAAGHARPGRLARPQDLRKAALALLKPRGLPPAVGVYYRARPGGGSEARMGAVLAAPDCSFAQELCVDETVCDFRGRADAPAPTPGTWVDAPSANGGIRAVAEAKAAQPGLFLFREHSLRAFRELRARVNGEWVTPVRANGIFYAVPVPAGDVRVELLPRWRFGAFGAACAAVVFVVSALILWARRKNEPLSPELSRHE